MGVVNLRDAIILALLKERTYTKKELENSLKITKTYTRKTLGFLRTSGLVKVRRIGGKSVYAITDEGLSELNEVYKKMRR